MKQKYFHTIKKVKKALLEKFKPCQKTVIKIASKIVKKIISQIFKNEPRIRQNQEENI